MHTSDNPPIPLAFEVSLASAKRDRRRALRYRSRYGETVCYRDGRGSFFGSNADYGRQWVFEGFSGGTILSGRSVAGDWRGTNELQRIIIARQLLQKYAP